MEFILNDTEREILEAINRKFNWEIAGEGDTWYVLNAVMESIRTNTKHYYTDVLYDVARLTPLMWSNDPAEDRFVAVFGIREFGIDGIEFVNSRLDAWKYNYKDIFLLREVSDDRGRRSFILYRAMGERKMEEEEEI